MVIGPDSISDRLADVRFEPPQVGDVEPTDDVVADNLDSTSLNNPTI